MRLASAALNPPHSLSPKPAVSGENPLWAANSLKAEVGRKRFEMAKLVKKLINCEVVFTRPKFPVAIAAGVAVQLETGEPRLVHQIDQLRG